MYDITPQAGQMPGVSAGRLGPPGVQRRGHASPRVCRWSDRDEDIAMATKDNQSETAVSALCVLCSPLCPNCAVRSVRDPHSILQHRRAVAATGTANCAAHAAVLVHWCDDCSMRQVPPIGSFTSTVTGVALWLRSVISYSTS